MLAAVPCWQGANPSCLVQLALPRLFAVFVIAWPSPSVSCIFRCRRVLEYTHHSISHDNSVGTFAYLAPELLTGCKCTQAVDLYSFGVLLWELCTGAAGACGFSDPEDQDSNGPFA